MFNVCVCELFYKLVILFSSLAHLLAKKTSEALLIFFYKSLDNPFHMYFLYQILSTQSMSSDMILYEGTSMKW